MPRKMLPRSNFRVFMLIDKDSRLLFRRVKQVFKRNANGEIVYSHTDKLALTAKASQARMFSKPWRARNAIPEELKGRLIIGHYRLQLIEEISPDSLPVLKEERFSYVSDPSLNLPRERAITEAGKRIRQYLVNLESEISKKGIKLNSLKNLKEAVYSLEYEDDNYE